MKKILIPGRTQQWFGSLSTSLACWQHEILWLDGNRCQSLKWLFTDTVKTLSDCKKQLTKGTRPCQTWAFFKKRNCSLFRSWLLPLSHLSFPHRASYWHILRFQYLNPGLLLLILFTSQISLLVWVFLNSQLLSWMSAFALTYETTKIFPVQDKDKPDFQGASLWINYSTLLFFVKAQGNLMCWQLSFPPSSSGCPSICYSKLISSLQLTQTLNWRCLLNAPETYGKEVSSLASH